MNLAKTLVCDMRVDLRCGDRGVAEEGLDGADVGTVSEQVRCERMPQRVRGDVLRDTGGTRVVIDDALDAARR